METPSELSPSRRSVRPFASLFVGLVARGVAARSGTGDGLAGVPLWVRLLIPGAGFMTPSGGPCVPTFPRVSVWVSFPDGSEYASFCYKYVDLLSLSRRFFPTLCSGLTFPPFQVQGERDETAALRSCATDMFREAHVEVIVAEISRGADSIPKSRQAGRSAQADLPPMRFTWIDRCDVNEPGAIVPRRGDGRPEDQRICPQAEPT